jgi:23S rRNA (adenine2030-N6)-methyltransferase
MNYRHQFHAGNFADVFKHTILVRLFQALRQKEGGFAYIDTHAGAGRYDLHAAESRKTGEYRDGVERLWVGGTDVEFEEYLRAVRAINLGPALRYYPGSPRIARFCMRAQDRMRVAEGAPQECERLRAEFARDDQVEVSCTDGYTALSAWLPPPERRGLVLIDPPYEQSEEWQRVPDALLSSSKRWMQGIYAVWYPLKAGAPVDQFKTKLISTGLRKMLSVELSLWPSDAPFRLNGCGMVILNPPWRLEIALERLLVSLVGRLKQGPKSRTQVAWLVPE